ncbi:hypothetical protein S245_045630, partial [Arachis hypogaea]
VSQEQVLNQVWFYLGKAGAGNKAYWLLQQQNKVMEILVPSLEIESSLHRK